MSEVLLRVDGVEVVLPEGRRILGPASLQVAPATFTAVLGPSGSGKSTLLRLMAGLAEPTAGAVEVEGKPAAQRVEALGYVPQRETVHDRLTVEEALRYAAVLRLDRHADIETIVADVLRELDLVEQAHTRIGRLSGGERRRAACGVELVGRPPVLLLDEPTSGLDPLLERRLMTTFRRLADQGRAVVVVTHATGSLDLCDTVAVLEPGGTLAFAGAAPEAREHLADVARRAGTGTEAHAAAPAGAPPRPVRPALTTRPFGVELSALVGRYARTVLRDRRTLAALLLQAPLIGLLIGLVLPPRALTAVQSSPADAVFLVFLLMTGAIWLGVTSACREVVKERSIVEREFDVGLRLDAYVLSKAVVLFALTTLQVLLMVGVAVALQPFGAGPDGALLLTGLAVGTAWTSVAMGLVVSAAARSVDQAAGVVPVLLIPQLLFAGALIPLGRMPQLIEALAQLTYARWSYAAMGSAAGLERRLENASDVAGVLGFTRGFFAISPAVGAAALAGFTGVLLLVAVLLLERRAETDG